MARSGVDDLPVPVAETVAGVRTHWDGLFLFGAPDVAVVNVTKEIWYRMAALSHAAGVAPPGKWSSRLVRESVRESCGISA
jgi:hypothetical protein